MKNKKNYFNIKIILKRIITTIQEGKSHLRKYETNWRHSMNMEHKKINPGPRKFLRRKISMPTKVNLQLAKPIFVGTREICLFSNINPF